MKRHFSLTSQTMLSWNHLSIPFHIICFQSFSSSFLCSLMDGLIIWYLVIWSFLADEIYCEISEHTIHCVDRRWVPLVQPTTTLSHMKKKLTYFFPFLSFTGYSKEQQHQSRKIFIFFMHPSYQWLSLTKTYSQQAIVSIGTSIRQSRGYSVLLLIDCHLLTLEPL